MRGKKGTIVFSVLLILAVLIGSYDGKRLTAATTTPPPASKTMTVGHMGPMSGSAAPWGWVVLRSLQMRVDEINAAGGLKVGGDIYNIKVVSYDHKARADEATTVAKRLVFQDQVKYILGNNVGATQDAAQLVSEPNKVFFSFGAWGKGLLGISKPYSFRNYVSTWEIADPFYEWVYKKFPEVRTLAILDPNDTSGWDSAKGGITAAEKLGIKTVAEVYYERGTTDFGPFVTKILAAKPDMVDFSGSPPGDAALVAKGLQERGYKGVKIFLAGIDPKPFMDIAGSAADETHMALSWDLEGDYARPALKTLTKKYNAKYPAEPLTTVGLANYAVSGVVFETMSMIASTDVDKVIQAIGVPGKQFDTIMGPITLGGKQTYGIDRQFLHPIVISVIRGGKLIDLEEVKPIGLR